MDSLGAVELRNAVSADFSCTVPATLAFDYPTRAAIVDYIASQIGTRRTRLPIMRTTTATAGGGVGSTTEIVAVGCKYPGSANGESSTHYASKAAYSATPTSLRP
jgi:hypothetical protein